MQPAVIKHGKFISYILSGIVLFPGMLAGVLIPLTKKEGSLHLEDFKLGIIAVCVATMLSLLNKRTLVSTRKITRSYNWCWLPFYRSHETYKGATHLVISKRVIQSKESSCTVYPLHIHTESKQRYLILESKNISHIRRQSEALAKSLQLDVHYDLPNNQKVRTFADLDAPLVDVTRDDELSLQQPEKSNVTIEPSFQGVSLRVGMHGGWPMFIVVGILEIIAIFIWSSTGFSEGPLFFRLWTLMIVTMIFNVALIKMAYGWWPRRVFVDKNGVRVGRYFFPSEELEEINDGATRFGLKLLEFTSDRKLLKRFAGHEDEDLQFIRAAVIHGLRGGRL